jgi:oxygen-independent coproporphyrinogen-3 oxidase
MEKYVDALSREMWQIAEAYSDQPLQTIFFGGGTPTLLPPRLMEKVLQSLYQTFRVDGQVELTFEANPGSVDREKLAVMKEYGVNRLSFGVQSFDDAMLHSLGRLHDVDTVYNSWKLARKAGFDSINLDLMIGLPGQTLELVEDSLRKLLDLGPEHVSVYGLKIEPGTPFAKWYDQGHLQLPPEELDVRMYETVRKVLQDHGYEQYEISNFAKPGHHSRHNTVYWRNEPYMAVGAGAHGYVQNIRYENIRKLDTYIETLEQGCQPIEGSFSVSPEMEEEDTMILGLRLSEGVTFERFEMRHQKPMLAVFGDVIQTFEQKGLLIVDERGVRLHPSAYIIGNEVFAEFLRTT